MKAVFIHYFKDEHKRRMAPEYLEIVEVEPSGNNMYRVKTGRGGEYLKNRFSKLADPPEDTIVVGIDTNSHSHEGFISN